MSKLHVMKDLGYSRTPTTAMLRVEMPDGVWEIPVQVIADSRDAYYADEQEDTIGFIRNNSLDNFEIYDWANNNMNWSDVSEYAFKVSTPTVQVDYEEGWNNGSKSIVGKV